MAPSSLLLFNTFYPGTWADLSKTWKMSRSQKNAKPISQIPIENFTLPAIPEDGIWRDNHRDLNEQIAARTRYVSEQ